MGYREVMAMPMRAFWAVSGFVERLQADEGRLPLEIQNAAQDADATQALYERLNTQAPSPVKYTSDAIVMMGAVRDEGASETLRALAG